jgi:hypothetical protein
MSAVHFLAFLGILLAGESRHLVRDLDRVRADWLAVVPSGFDEALDPLGDRRASSMRVAYVRADEVAVGFGPGPEGIRALVERVKPRFLLLAGDADRVPTFRRPGAYRSDRFASDEDAAGDFPYGVPVGRLPADTPEELRGMAERIAAFEGLPGGMWQKRIGFVCGQAGFNAVVDQAIERQFNQVVAQGIPASYDVEVAFADPRSKYGAYPPAFHENAMRMLNEGSLFYVYLGHGYRKSFDTVTYKDRTYPIFDEKRLGEIGVREGRPIMVVIACSTGEFDAPEDCIGEAILKRPGGPVAFIGGSRTTQPYANALLSRHLVDQVFAKEAATLGEALHGAKEALLGQDASPLRMQADALAAMIQGPQALEPMRQDVVLHYNLLGDPATPLRRPGNDLELSVKGFPGPGRTFTVTGRAPDGPLELTFEVPRDRFAHPVELEGEDPAAAMARRYRNANRKWIVRVPAASMNGEFEAEVELPASVKSGQHFLKLWAADRATAVEVLIP